MPRHNCLKKKEVATSNASEATTASRSLSDDDSHDDRLEEQDRRRSTATVTDGAEAKTPVENTAEVHEPNPDSVESRLLTTSVLLQRRQQALPSCMNS